MLSPTFLYKDNNESYKYFSMCSLLNYIHNKVFFFLAFNYFFFQFFPFHNYSTEADKQWKTHNLCDIPIRGGQKRNKIFKIQSI